MTNDEVREHLESLLETADEATANKIQSLIKRTCPPVEDVVLGGVSMTSRTCDGVVFYTANLLDENKLRSGIKVFPEKESWTAEFFVSADDRDKDPRTSTPGLDSNVKIQVRRKFFQTKSPEQIFALVKKALPGIRKTLDTFEKMEKRQ